jgi:hypothetical protein
LLHRTIGDGGTSPAHRIQLSGNSRPAVAAALSQGFVGRQPRWAAMTLAADGVLMNAFAAADRVDRLQV